LDIHGLCRPNRLVVEKDAIVAITFIRLFLGKISVLDVQRFLKSCPG
jgi:hypothetical protein